MRLDLLGSILVIWRRHIIIRSSSQKKIDPVLKDMKSSIGSTIMSTAIIIIWIQYRRMYWRRFHKGMSNWLLIRQIKMFFQFSSKFRKLFIPFLFVYFPTSTFSAGTTTVLQSHPESGIIKYCTIFATVSVRLNPILLISRPLFHSLEEKISELSDISGNK